MVRFHLTMALVNAMGFTLFTAVSKVDPKANVDFFLAATLFFIVYFLCGAWYEYRKTKGR